MLLAVQLPKWLSFLSLGWFLLHAVLIAAAFFLGVHTGSRLRPKSGPQPPVSQPEE